MPSPSEAPTHDCCFPFTIGGTRDDTKALLCGYDPTSRRDLLNFLVLKPPLSVLKMESLLVLLDAGGKDVCESECVC